MTKADNYIGELIVDIINKGYLDENPRPKYSDGTPAHTLSVNGRFREYDISNNEFPITTLRPIAWKSAIKEILWIYQDQSNDLSLLRDKYNVRYWDQWESESIPKTIGVRYGEIVRRHNLMDKLLDGLINNPFGRRHIIDLYQYSDMKESDGLNPCAFCTIWNVRKGKDKNLYLDLSLIQRSGDLIAASCSGVNEIQYTALLMMVARHCGYKPGKLFHYVANEQIYSKQSEAASELLSRWKSKHKAQDTSFILSAPILTLNPDKRDFYSFTIDDFEMQNYEPMQPQLRFELGV